VAQENKAIAYPIAVPELPDKLFFSIREVSDICGVEPHVLRYWESEFDVISPTKRSGNRRFYRKEDIVNILQIRSLLYDRKFTIRGAQQEIQRLRDGGEPLEETIQPIEPPHVSNDMRPVLREIRDELKAILALLDQPQQRG